MGFLKLPRQKTKVRKEMFLSRNAELDSRGAKNLLHSSITLIGLLILLRTKEIADNVTQTQSYNVFIPLLNKLLKAKRDFH